MPTRWIFVEGNIVGGGIRESPADPAVGELGTYGISMRENREIPWSPVLWSGAGREGNAEAVIPRCTIAGSQTGP